MAYGRKDYFWGMAPEKAVYGELQTPYVETQALQISGGGNQTLITYAPSSGYIYNVTGLVLGADTPGVCRWDVQVDSEYWALGHFDVFANIALGSGGEIVVNGGETVTVNIYNLKDYTIWFTAYMYGFLQQTIV
jgi:hypothetical protein